MEFHHLLVKAERFLRAGNLLQSQEDRVSPDAQSLVNSGRPSDSGIELVERGYQQPHNADDMTFANIAGLLPVADKVRFERMLFRATRGNCYVRFSSLGSKARDAYDKPIAKICFIVFYKSDAIETKIKRICDAFGANRYDLSNLARPAELAAQRDNNSREIIDAKKIIDANAMQRGRLCEQAAEHLQRWTWIVRREKGIYHTLNLFKNDVAGNLLRGRAWVLSSKVRKAYAVLRKAHSALSLPNTSLLELVPESHQPTPPTHFPTNEVTWAFQEFVNTYGIPRYQEANPALFTAATFPFLFGVMYGDIGHGSCLTLGALFLLLSNRYVDFRKTGDILGAVYKARFMLFGMGIMAVYAGLIYNDYFSLGLNLFGTRWTFPDLATGTKAVRTGSGLYGDPNTVYPFGVDPAWHVSSNDLLFFNSMKMKTAVILGISQMTFGVVLRGMNAVHNRSRLDFFAEFLPMIIFDVAFFGYMVILIFIKWSINWDQRMALGTCSYDIAGNLGACTLSDTVTHCYTPDHRVCTALSPLSEVCPLNYGGTSGGCAAPNLITTLINVALKPGSVEEPMYAGQAGVQTVILLVAFICVPWLLLVKPFYLKFTHKPAAPAAAGHGHGHAAPGDAENPLLGDGSDHGFDNPHGDAAHGGGGHGGHGHGEEFNFSEIFIHQAIETIEFVLGMVSNTASYLRLWALSLAHSELARVFWEKAMLAAINTGNPVAIFIGFAIFAAVTFGVLLAMDVLECFLHALRLHWVEFQNKFFKAEGIRFQPFDFKTILEAKAAD